MQQNTQRACRFFLVLQNMGCLQYSYMIQHLQPLIYLKSPLFPHHRYVCLSINTIGSQILSDCHFPTISVGEQLLLVVQKLLVGFGRELIIRAFHNGIYRTSFLTKSAIYAFCHIDIVTRSLSTIVVTRLGLDSNGLNKL